MYDIEIINSKSLTQMSLDGLVGKRAKITEDLTDPERNTKGYMVMLEHEFQGELSWFIPYDALAYADDF